MSDSVALPSTSASGVPDVQAAEFHCPAFKVSGVFSSCMVVQREQPIHIWGFSDTPDSCVTGFFMGETVTARVGEDHRFTLTFSSRLYTTEGHDMVIFDDRGHSTTFKDVLIGDVWLIGGQSNAELTMGSCMALTPSVEFSESDSFRLFTQTQAFAVAHPEYCTAPQDDVICPDWHWQKPGREASRHFSAMGWFFAHEVTRFMDIPLGMIMMAAGGACLSELMPVELARKEGYTKGANVPLGGYFHSLIHPFIGLSFKGMLFFQGESEALSPATASVYDRQLAHFVADEREKFGFRFPFYNVQLSDYLDTGAKLFANTDLVRVKQFDALSLIPDSTLTVDMDLGAPEDWTEWAHSPRKMELGERLAKLVLAREYDIGRESNVSSPRPVSAVLSEDGKQIQVDFTDVDQGLIVSGHAPVDSCDREVQGFSVGDTEQRIPAKAVITRRSTVTVEVPDGAIPTHVHYAYFNRVTPDRADLRGGNNLPCPAFCIPVIRR